MTLVAVCLHVLARARSWHHRPRRRIPASPALVNVLNDDDDDDDDDNQTRLWAVLVQLVYPLPPHLHDRHVFVSHPAQPILQKIPDSPDFSLVTLVALPNCAHLTDDDVANLGSFHRLIALDLRGCSISSYALTALARSLVRGHTCSGTWRLRLLCLHACANIDNNVFFALPKFPLLSVIDLRFTRCTPSAVNAYLSPLGFRPSNNNSLFHPAPLSLALCSLEKIALSASEPISLYSCPPKSVFRVHVDEINHPPSHTKKSVLPSSGSAIAFAEDTVVFIPPLRKPTKSEPAPLSTPSAHVPAIPSNVASFYDNAPARKNSRKNILPLSAQAVQPSRGGKLDPLAIVRSPPSWNILDTYTPPCRQDVEHSRRTQPTAAYTRQTLDDPLQVDRTRLHKRNSDAVADMVHQFTAKRPKIESEFALAKIRAKASVRSHNPFTKSARSVFAESSVTVRDTPPQESPKGFHPDVQPQIRRTLHARPLKPITTIKPPILPKELLPSLPRQASKPSRTVLKQTRLPFARGGEK